MVITEETASCEVFAIYKFLGTKQGQARDSEWVLLLKKST